MHDELKEKLSIHLRVWKLASLYIGKSCGSKVMNMASIVKRMSLNTLIFLSAPHVNIHENMVSLSQFLVACNLFEVKKTQLDDGDGDVASNDKMNNDNLDEVIE